MKEISDRTLIDSYISRYELSAIFDSDVRQMMTLLYYDSGELLISYGQVSRYLLFLVRGKCSFYTFSENGEHVSLGIADSFQVFGEVSSLWNWPPNNVVEALTPAWCLAIDLDKHRDKLLDDNGFLRYLCRLLSRRVLHSNKALTSYVGARAGNRLASFILNNQHGGVFSHKLTLCSEAIAVSYRHVLRLMEELCKEKILKKDGRKYRIIDARKLSRLAQPAGKEYN